VQYSAKVVKTRKPKNQMISAGWTGLEPAASGVTGPMVRYGAVRPRSQNPLKSPSFASLSLQVAPSDYIRTRMFWSTDRVQNFLASDCEIGITEGPPTSVPGRDATAVGAENWPILRRLLGPLCGRAFTTCWPFR
jgi:hypothetical protein